MKKIFIAVCLIVLGHNLSAQPTLDSIKLELYRINRVFDSSNYLGFDLNIIYASDTVLGKFDHEEIDGKYILNARNVYYRMGNVEYIQNDSFVYNIYHDEKMMIMTKLSASPFNNPFPLREFVDSMINWYDSSYTITMNDEGDSRVIKFTANVPGLPYQRFAVYYDSSNRYLDKFEMSFYEPVETMSDMPDSIAELIRLKTVMKKVTMNFSNYYSPSTLEIFNDENYVTFDRLRRRFQPAEKYSSYRFLANGTNGDEEDMSIELSAPPNGN